MWGARSKKELKKKKGLKHRKRGVGGGGGEVWGAQTKLKGYDRQKLKAWFWKRNYPWNLDNIPENSWLP